RRRLREEDGRRSGRRRLGQLRIRDHRVLPHPRWVARRTAARRHTRRPGPQAHERDRHGGQRPRLLHRHLRQRWPGSAGRRREAQSGSVEIRDGAIDSVIARGERGIGIRVLEEQRLGFAYTSDLSTDGIRACADTARRMSGVTEADKDLALATRPIDDADLDIYQAGIVNRALVERGNVALAVEDAARATDPRVTQFRKTTYSDSESTTIIATTTGMRGSYRA